MRWKGRRTRETVGCERSNGGGDSDKYEDECVGGEVRKGKNPEVADIGVSANGARVKDVIDELEAVRERETSVLTLSVLTIGIDILRVRFGDTVRGLNDGRDGGAWSERYEARSGRFDGWERARWRCGGDVRRPNSPAAGETSRVDAVAAVSDGGDCCSMSTSCSSSSTT